MQVTVSYGVQSNWFHFDKNFVITLRLMYLPFQTKCKQKLYMDKVH